MSVTNRNGSKVVLYRPEQLWSAIEDGYAGTDQLRWKRLACLHLYVHCRWHMEMIGLAFGHPKGHISRIIRQTIGELRDRFELPREFEERLDQADSEAAAA